MTSPENWSPTPEQLAAYADGELESCADERLRTQIEAWLDRNPEARTELAEVRRLREFCETHGPDQPTPETWKRVFNRIYAGLEPAAVAETQQHRSWRRTAVALVGAAAVVLLAFTLWPNGEPRDETDDEVLIVAAAHEIEIVSMAGADTNTLVVGDPPLKGTLELLAPGDITVTSIQPSDRDNMRPELRDRPPMIWARLDTEVD